MTPDPTCQNHCAAVLVARFTGEVEDNLSIHSKASLYEAFPAVEARRFEWHYTPKHGSWLDLAESELGS